MMMMGKSIHQKWVNQTVFKRWFKKSLYFVSFLQFDMIFGGEEFEITDVDFIG